MRNVIAGAVIALVGLGCPDYKQRGRPDGSVQPPPGLDGSITLPPPPPDAKPPYPGSGGGTGSLKDPGLGVLILVRLDRSGVNLVNPYSDAIQDMLATFNDKIFKVNGIAVGALYDGSLFWEWSVPGPHGYMQTAVEYAPMNVPSICPTAPLAALTADLSAQTVTYLNDPETYYPFGVPLSALAVIVIDHGDRPLAHNDPGCLVQGVSPATWFGANKEAQWLNTGGTGFTVPRVQTRFWFITSDEGTTYAAERERCANVGGFPREGLDSVEPSELAFYGPLVDGMNAHQANLATRTHLCDFFGSNVATQAKTFASKWIDDMKAAATP